LDQVNEYDVVSEDNQEYKKVDGTTTTTTSSATNQIIVRFDTSPNNDNGSTTTTKTVLTREEIEQRAQQVATYLGGTVLQIYEHVFYGATIGNLPPSTTTANIISSTSGYKTFTGTETSNVNVPNFSYETDTTIGRITNNYKVASIDRINQPKLPLDKTYNYKYDGYGVTVFVVDTGIRTTHVDLAQTSITCGYSAFTDTENAGCDDHNGHGTHVAGTIASHTYGVAKGVNLITVKVMDKNGGGSYSTVLGGIEYMIQYKQSYPDAPMVANLSIGGAFSDAMNTAVASAVTNNIVMVVAAGNDNTDACTTSPASTPDAITVGASRQVIQSSILALFNPFRNERRAAYSNYGSCVDVFTWGSDVVSLGITSTTETVSRSGTSMSTPHVAGTAAMYLHRDPTLTPSQIKELLIQDSSDSQLQRWYQKKSPNRTLNTQNIV
jgi:subtilisin family serine protease